MLNEAAVVRLRALAQDWVTYLAYDESDDGSGDTGAENAAYNDAGGKLHDLLDELIGTPRCRFCYQFIVGPDVLGNWGVRYTEYGLGLWRCMMNLSKATEGAQDHGRHVPETKTPN